MKKNRIIILILIFVILLCSLSLTYTYFIINENTQSIITFGNIKLKLEETTLKDGKYVNVNDNDIIDISNKKELSRVVKVKNVGSNPFYLRIQIKFNGLDGNNNNIDGINLINLDIDDDWLYQDGYYYYKKILYPKEETTELMKKIKFDNQKINQEYKGSKFKLEITAQAVQSENNSNNILEVEGWPK